MIDVTDPAYGATGDGITDDAPAIQAALDCGGWVYLPAGVYRIATPPLVIGARTRLSLDPGARLVRDGAHGLLYNGSGTAGGGGYGGNGGIVIEGGVWDLQGVAGDAAGIYVCGISIGHADDVIIRDLTVLDVAGVHAIEVNSSRMVRVENCRFAGFVAKEGDGTSREAIQIDGAFDVGGFGFGPYDSTVCDDVRISGCWFGPSGTEGTTAWPRAVGSHGYLDTTRPRHKRITIDHNTMTGTLDGAVRAWFWEQVLVAYNHIYGSQGEGITVQRCQYVDVTHNQVFDAGRSGVWINDNNGNIGIHGNTLIGSGAAADNTHYGIRVSGTCGVVNVVANKVRKRSTGPSAKYGLSLSDSSITGVYRHGNDLRSSGVSGSLQDASASPVSSATDVL